jgi:transposase-like protein
MLSAKRNRKAAKRFFKKALSSNHNQIPRVITVDKNPAYPPAIDELKNDKILPKNVGIRQIKYLNNIVEQDHRSSATRKAMSEITDNPSPFRLGCPHYGMRSW